MRNKKLGLIILAIVLLGALYYMSTNKSHTPETLQQSNTLKQQVNAQLTLMQKSGFTLSNRKVKKEKEYFVITLNDPKKATLFFAQKGLRIELEEAQELKGLQMGVEVSYLNDTIGLDLYPVALPTHLKTILAQEDNKILAAQIDQMLKDKVLFIHIETDYTGSAFNGYVKDISETLKNQIAIELTLQGYTFSGELKDERVTKFKQSLDESHLQIGNEINRHISGMESSYVLTGATVYDYVSDYSIEKIEIDEAPMVTLVVNNIFLHANSEVENGLATETLNAKIDDINIFTQAEKIRMKYVVLDMNVSNIDVVAFEKLQQTKRKNEKEYDALIETLVSKNMHVEIPMLSAEQVVLHEKEMGGLSLQANLDVDQSLDIYRLGINPKHLLDKVNGEIHLSMSKELLDMIKKDPKAMLTYMMYRPKRALGQRIYHIRIGHGDLKINGKAVKF